MYHRLLKQIVFLKLVHTESQVNHKTHPFCVKGVHLVHNGHMLAGQAVGFCDLLGTRSVCTSFKNTVC